MDRTPRSLIDANERVPSACYGVADSESGKSRVDLTLVLPTYKERENLPELFDRIDRVLDGLHFEVIVVDDDSPDQTWLVAQDFRQRYRWLRVIRRPGLRGLSSAVVCGFRHSRGKILAGMDADLQHDIRLYRHCCKRRPTPSLPLRRGVVREVATENGRHSADSEVC